MGEELILTPNHFSVESGFEPGVVVQAIHTDNKTHVGYFGWSWRDQITYGDHFGVPLSEIKSITILTGPMRFWAGAPEWAGFCAVHKLNGHVSYYTGIDEIDRFIMGESDIDHYELTNRPFWCDFGKEA